MPRPPMERGSQKKALFAFQVEEMPQFLALCHQILEVFRPGFRFYGNPSHHLKTIAFQPFYFLWVIRHNFHFSNIEGSQDLGPNTIISEVRIKSQFFVSPVLPPTP